MDNKISLKDIECFVFDMDGTLYSGELLFDGVKELFRYFIEKQIKFYFLTNNSSKTGQEYLNKLIRLGIHNVNVKQIITSGDITINYLKKYGYKKVCLVGTRELENQFIYAGFKLVKKKFQQVDCVVVGFDTSFDYYKGDVASFYVRKGAPFYATNEDLVCPIENGEFIPDCGAVTSFIEKASGSVARYLGKPSSETYEYLVNFTKVSKEKLAIVGDRLYTDLAIGIKHDFCSIGVLSGELKMEDLKSSVIKPLFIFDNIEALYKALVK